MPLSILIMIDFDNDLGTLTMILFWSWWHTLNSDILGKRVESDKSRHHFSDAALVCVFGMLESSRPGGESSAGGWKVDSWWQQAGTRLPCCLSQIPAFAMYIYTCLLRLFCMRSVHSQWLHLNAWAWASKKVAFWGKADWKVLPRSLFSLQIVFIWILMRASCIHLSLKDNGWQVNATWEDWKAQVDTSKGGKLSHSSFTISLWEIFQ